LQVKQKYKIEQDIKNNCLDEKLMELFGSVIINNQDSYIKFY